MNHYEEKATTVKNGSSRIFNNWKENAGITEADFLEALRWVCDDPEDGSTGGRPGQLTREIMADEKAGRVVKMKRLYTDGVVTFVRQDTGLTITGPISISARDSI